MNTLVKRNRGSLIKHLTRVALVGLCTWTASALALEPLLIPLGQPATKNLRQQVVAAQRVKVNPRALQSPVISIDLMGETVLAQRDSVQREKGLKIWIGHLEGSPMDRVVVTSRGRSWSALIQRGSQLFQLGLDNEGHNRLEEWMPLALPDDDAADLPDGGGDLEMNTVEVQPGVVEQDLLVVYTQAACYFTGSCDQLEADVLTAVADLNAAYQDSGIQVRMNVVGLAVTQYELTGAQKALEHLSGQNDGYMDEVHALRDDTGADIVSLVYDGAGCGIGYVNASADKAFNVTDVPCLLANRTLAHEIAHNQGANHDRTTLGTPSVTTYNYGFRRCDDPSAADHAPAPHFRTIMSYGCGTTPRRGVFSSPSRHYEGVSQGIDPVLSPSKGTDNARRINERAATVAAFRSRSLQVLPASPIELNAEPSGVDAIRLRWSDRASDERGYVVQVSASGTGGWRNAATLPADSQAWTHGGLQPSTDYYYRVFATNAAGSSSYSGVAGARTESVPTFVDDYAIADRPGFGDVSGDFRSTHGRDIRTTVLAEKATRHGKQASQSFRHAWEFDVTGGSGGVVVSVSAWVSGHEGAAFWYSTDQGATRLPMMTINNNAPDAARTFVLPQALSGRLWIGVNDAEQQAGERPDSVFVDQIVIRSWEGKGHAPLAPADLMLDAIDARSVNFSFQSQSDNEWGFDVWRSDRIVADCRNGLLVGSLSGAAGRTAFTDLSASPGTIYRYSVTAFNGAGESECSEEIMVITSTGPATALNSAVGFKVKGAQHVALEWTSTAEVDVYRNGLRLQTGLAGAMWTDVIGSKGRGSYDYWVCETGTAICSETLSVNF